MCVQVKASRCAARIAAACKSVRCAQRACGAKNPTTQAGCTCTCPDVGMMHVRSCSPVWVAVWLCGIHRLPAFYFFHSSIV